MLQHALDDAIGAASVLGEERRRGALRFVPVVIANCDTESGAVVDDVPDPLSFFSPITPDRSAADRDGAGDDAGLHSTALAAASRARSRLVIRSRSVTRPTPAVGPIIGPGGVCGDNPATTPDQESSLTGQPGETAIPRSIRSCCNS